MHRGKFRGRFLATGALQVFVLAFVLNPAVLSQSNTQSRQLQQLEPVKAWPTKAKRWALIIGVDQYSDPQISPLKGAANDAHNLADALVRYAGFPADQVILLATDQPLERQPTRLNILRRLSNLSSLVPKDGLLLISFAGHGIERGGQAYLVPADSQLTDDISLLEESAVSVTRMHDRIKATGVSQVVVLLDACRNDPGGRADAPNPLTQSYVKGFNFDVRNREVTAFATLYATAVGQRAYEYTEKKQGYFTWAVVEGLKGGAANDKGEVTLAGLVKFVQERVPKRVAIDLGSGKPQRPFYQIEGYKADELVIAIGTNANSNVPVSVSAAVDPTAVELSYWDSIKNSSSVDDFRSYLEKYPDGQFSALARNKVRSLESSAKSETKPSSDVATDLAFWDSIKTSTNPEDFKAYLEKFPAGTFTALAKNRMSSLEAATEPMIGSWKGSSPGGDKLYDVEFATNGQVFWKTTLGGGVISQEGTWKRSGNRVSMEFSWQGQPDPVQATLNDRTLTGSSLNAKYKFTLMKIGAPPSNGQEASRRLAEEIQRQTKTYRISWGFKSSVKDQFWTASLTFSPGQFRFTDDAGKNIQWDCASFEKAIIDGYWIREISCGIGKCRLKAESATDAEKILDSINGTCKGRIGMRLGILTPEFVEKFGLDSHSTGVVVVELVPGGIAASSGIKEGDIIEEIDNLPVKSPVECIAAIRSMGDRRVPALINRRGEKILIMIAANH